MLELDMDPSSDNDQYLVMNKEEEGDDDMISYWSRDDGNWFFDEVRRDFANEGKDLYDITEAMHAWKPLKGEDWSVELKKGEEKSDKT